jgi:uncharacterized protein YwlG (UPF0340 family)
MNLHNEWKYIKSKILAIRELSLFFVNGRVPASLMDDDAMPLLRSIGQVFNNISNFQSTHNKTIPADANKILSNFLDDSEKCKICSTENLEGKYKYGVLIGSVIELCSFEIEFSFILSNRNETIKRIAQRAFLHLSRSLVVDETFAEKWNHAFNNTKTAEIKLEGLGGVHLLLHGIWGVKSNAKGERTDLILGDTLSIANNVEEVAEGLILTEWKVARSKTDEKKKWGEALEQAKLYSSGSLAGFELQNVRYLVLVTEKCADCPNDITEDDVIYKHINIAINPLSPSETARGKGSVAPTHSPEPVASLD